MMGKHASEEEILLQLQFLVFDSLQVVSYKWLSREFSFSSNTAKRLLQVFCKQNSHQALEVVYAVSGWTKSEPRSYSIHLAPKSKLKEVMGRLRETPSTHIYSVQRCLPKDSAHLWSTDFVQAEHLFNEAPDVVNCLRDNRFSAVSCALVTRNAAGKIARISPPAPQVTELKPQIHGGPAKNSPCFPPLHPLQSDSKNSEAEGKDSSAVKNLNKVETAVLVPTTKKKAVAVAGSSGGGGGTGGSLATMWGRASSKPLNAKPTRETPKFVAEPARPPLVPAGDAEARILALEAEAGSDDDDVAEFASLRRGKLTTSAGRRRRMVVDEQDSGSDNDADPFGSETIVRLASPEPASPEPFSERVLPVPANQSTHSIDESQNEEFSGPSEMGKEFSAINALTEKGHVLGNSRDGSVEQKPVLDGQAGVMVIKDHAVESSNGTKRETDETAGNAQTHSVSKRKKVMTVVRDERGKEVTQVRWENEGDENESKQNVLKLLPCKGKLASERTSTAQGKILKKDEVTLAMDESSSVQNKKLKKDEGKPLSDKLSRVPTTKGKNDEAKLSTDKPRTLKVPNSTSKLNSIKGSSSSKPSAKPSGKQQGNLLAFFKKSA